MPRDAVLSLAAVRRAWCADLTRAVPQIAAEFGICPRTLGKIARAQGWPPRSRRKHSARLTEVRVRPMYDAGLSCAEIGRAFGVTGHAVQAFARRRGWPGRGQRWRPSITLAQWHDACAARAMAGVARREGARARAEYGRGAV
jgi:hypothetical protein